MVRENPFKGKLGAGSGGHLEEQVAAPGRIDKVEKTAYHSLKHAPALGHCPPTTSARIIMHVRLAFGRDGLDIDVPERHLMKVLTMGGARPVPDPTAEVRASLLDPLDSPPLRERARAARSACIVICDITRPVPNTIVLPPILDTLKEAGIPRDRTTILIASGLHRPSTPAEVEALVGPSILDQYRIVNHRARARAEQQFLGTTARGTPVYIDAEYCRADLKITTGFIEPHLMAGFSGGRKLIAPGCAGEETIKGLHSPAFIEHPDVREGVIDGNPLHNELLEIAAMAGHDFIVNVTLDISHAITGVFSGHPILAHRRGVQYARASVRDTVPYPVDIVITTSAGFPLDLTFYQAVKGMTAALPVVKKGGMLIIAAECAEGLGSAEFTAMATAFPTAEAFTHAILSGPVTIDQWQLEECAKAVRHAEVVLVSPEIAGRYGNALFVRTSTSVEDSLREALERFGSSATVAVIPQGPYTLVDIDPAVAH